MKYIATINEYLNESYKLNKFNFKDDSYINDLKLELSKFKSEEELLRSGGLSIELLDRLAFGFTAEDITTLKPSELKIKWKDDLENVKYEISKSGLTPKQWAVKINLTEPIDVSYWQDKKHKRGFYIEDGHHRYTAAKILNKPLNVNLEIKVNPILVIAPNLGYDELHRELFKVFINGINESKDFYNNYLYHTTSLKNIVDILNSNSLEISKRFNGISFSRNSDYWYRGSNRPVRLVLDKNILKYKYKVKPFDFYNDGVYGDQRKFLPKSSIHRKAPYEFEEYIVNNIHDLNKYLVEIQIIDKYYIGKCRQLIEQYIDKYKIKLSLIDEYELDNSYKVLIKQNKIG